MPRGYTDRTPLKRTKFLAALRESASVTKACEMAAIGRVTAYQWRNSDPAFAEEWEATLDAAIEDLEAEARRRALVGIEKGVWHQGERVGTEIQYSDTMLIFLLKAAKPAKYRDNSRVELTGKDGGPIQTENLNEAAVLRYAQQFKLEPEAARAELAEAQRLLSNGVTVSNMVQ